MSVKWWGRGLLTFVFLAPWIFLFSQGGTPLTDLSADLIYESLIHTAILGVGVLTLTCVMGFSAAYVLKFCAPFGGRLFAVLTMCPLIFPPYVMGYVYLGALEPTEFSPQGQLWGLIGVLSLSLFPYVLMFSRLGLDQVGQGDWEAHRVLGQTPFVFFKKTVLGKSAPFFLSGAALVLFETLSEFGGASVMNVNVVTTLIYKTWFGFFSFPQAVTIAMYYLLFVALLLFLEKMVLKRPATMARQTPIPGDPGNFRRLVGTSYLLFIVGVSFLFPLYQLVAWASRGTESFFDYGGILSQSLGLSFGVALVVVFFALVFCGFQRKRRSPSRYSILLFSVNYSLPGVLLAVGTVGLGRWIFPEQSFFLQVCILGVGMTYKFAIVALRSFCQTLSALSFSLDDYHGLTQKSRFHFYRYGLLPRLRPAVFGVLVMVVVEVLKEMPLTLMLAPSQMQTLSIRLFNLTSEGEWERAAVPALLLVLAGAISTGLFLFRMKGGSREFS